MTDTTTYAWAVLYPVGRGFGIPGQACTWTIRPTRRGALEAFSDSWRSREETASKTWQRAYRGGWRLARVAITPALGYGQ